MTGPETPADALAGHRLVFVGGLHRSGTTPLARVLAEHPQVSGFTATGATEDEGQHLQDVYPPARVHGGAGRFALRPEAHLTEASPLVSEVNARRLFDQWRPYWDLGCEVLVEKSPPNLVMTRFLQALYPEAYFVIIVRHPVVVALSTEKWLHAKTLRTPLANWFAAHDAFVADAGSLRRVHVVKYESLVRDPTAELGAIGAFLGLSGAVPSDSWQGGRSDTYTRTWQQLAVDKRPWKRLMRSSLVRTYAERAAGYGYDLEDLDLLHPWSLAGSS
jgi:Sulfotransferase family